MRGDFFMKVPYRTCLLLLAALHACGVLAAGSMETPEGELQPFQPIATAAELDAAVAAAQKAGRRVMLDFYADWCGPCHQMERETFADPGVRKALEDYALLRVDISEIDDADETLLERFAVAGLPVMVFYDAQGLELEECQLVGFADAEAFGAHLVKCQG
ncbi:thioredoxin family protein [Microbulbifer sp.]|uniref:thioredoxin family protein n=1 Tax=Microbulbifer sp. TaxID=1908541 RepID=UPI003F2B5961